MDINGIRYYKWHTKAEKFNYGIEIETIFKSFRLNLELGLNKFKILILIIITIIIILIIIVIIIVKIKHKKKITKIY